MKRVAQDELNDILIYWLRASRDKALTTRVEQTIRAKCRQLGVNVETGSPVEGTPLRVGYAVKGRFAIYYRVLGPRSIDVLAIKDNKQPRPLPAELMGRIATPPPPTPTPAPIANVPVSVPVAPTATVPAKTKAKAKTTMADLIGAAPTNSPEYIIFKGQGASLLDKDIEGRIEWLQSKAKRLHSKEYKDVAIAYLQEELGKRRRGE